MSKLRYRKIGLTAGQWAALEKKAKRCGFAVGEYIRKTVERNLLAEKSFAEIAKPVRDDVRKCGVTEHQVKEIVAEARRAFPKRGRKKTLRKLCSGRTPAMNSPEFNWGGPVGSEIW